MRTTYQNISIEIRVFSQKENQLRCNSCQKPRMLLGTFLAKCKRYNKKPRFFGHLVFAKCNMGTISIHTCLGEAFFDWHFFDYMEAWSWLNLHLSKKSRWPGDENFTFHFCEWSRKGFYWYPMILVRTQGLEQLGCSVTQLGRENLNWCVVELFSTIV